MLTNEELKKKIVEIVNETTIKVEGISFIGTAESIADALIAAGLRFGENLTATFDHMASEREHELERRLAEAEHRAEVAEMALKDCIDYYSYSGLCPVLDCNYNKACWRKECTSDIEKCFMIQAEKELAEDIDD